MTENEKRLQSLAADHFRNARRLAHRLVLAEDELRSLRSAIAIEAGTAKTAGLGPKGESAGLQGIAQKEQSA